MSEQMENKNIVGAMLRNIREGKKLSQKDVVDQINELGHSMTPSTISKIEKGKRGVSDIELKAFSVIYKCSINDFF